METMAYFTSMDSALMSLFGNGIQIRSRRRISGGDVNAAFELTLTGGKKIFRKANAKDKEAFFTAEAAGLAAIAQTGTIGTPHILCCGTEGGEDGYAFLLMELLAGNSPAPRCWETFGYELAALHRAPAAEFVPGGIFGFARDNYIGAREQKNTPAGNWRVFFRDCRLAPRLRDGARYFDTTMQSKASCLLERVEELLLEPAYPSLLHGDLWSGNVITGKDGRVWLIDPAVYVGHAEADLAMTELFGGFPPEFYAAYKEAAPLEPGYECRRDLYNLYHLLNHLNLFGSAYYPAVRRIVERYVP